MGYFFLHLLLFKQFSSFHLKKSEVLVVLKALFYSNIINNLELCLELG